ncbi:hypothetical protein BN2364_1257 [Alloalcanivorax xenomutans]|nr:hypothetical protein BN2364_1257 [Alloalcanivorax xenomutans]
MVTLFPANTLTVGLTSAPPATLPSVNVTFYGIVRQFRSDAAGRDGYTESQSGCANHALA